MVEKLTDDIASFRLGLGFDLFDPNIYISVKAGARGRDSLCS
jgi:hypothetical protein